MVKNPKKIALVPIGQSPRPDVAGDFKHIWQDAVTILESGALDGVADDEILALKPRQGEAELITKLADGQTVYVSHRRLIPYIERAVERSAGQGAELAIVLCTGDFSAVKAGIPVLEPNEVMAGSVVSVLKPGAAVTVIVPTISQKEEAAARWEQRGLKVARMTVAAPFGGHEDCIREIRTDPCIQASDGIIGDCFGFDLHFKAAMAAVYSKQIFIPRLLMAHLVQAVL